MRKLYESILLFHEHWYVYNYLSSDHMARNGERMLQQSILDKESTIDTTGRNCENLEAHEKQRTIVYEDQETK